VLTRPRARAYPPFCVDIGLGWIKALAVQMRAFCAPIRRRDRDPSCLPTPAGA